MRITCVVDDNSAPLAGTGPIKRVRGSFLSEHGLSLLIETNAGKKVLLDTGSSELTFCHNLAALECEPDDLDAVVISHGHYDHLGALPALLRAGVPCFTHPSTFIDERYVTSSGKMRYIGPSEELVRMLPGQDIVHDPAPREIVAGVRTTGQISRTNTFERPRSFVIRHEGVESPDMISEEQALCVSTRKGLVIVTGCGHPGVVNITSQVKRAYDRKVYMVMGGFHLHDASQDVLLRTMDGLKRLGVEKVVPMHCTGFEATKMLSDRFPGFELFGTGNYVDI